VSAWRAFFTAAVLRFGLSPGDVWALSVGEWLALADAAGGGAAALTGAELTFLVQQYPDETS